MDLDFSGLTDDQLIGLIRAACAEARDRGAATEAAARNVYLDEVERARIARAAELLEAERLRGEEAARVAREAAAKVRAEADRKKVDDAASSERRTWARRKGIAQALDAAGYDVKGDQLVVWLSGSGEKRVFLQARAFGSVTYATLYVTGNGRHAPDSIEFRSGLGADLKTALPPILRAIAKEWNAIKVDLEQALAWSGDAIPLKFLTPAEPEKATS